MARRSIKVSPTLLLPLLTTTLVAMPMPFLGFAVGHFTWVSGVSWAETAAAVTSADQLLLEGQQLLNQTQPPVPQLALDKLKQALALYRQNQNRQGEGRSLNAIGEAYYVLGQYDNAQTAYAQALSLYQKSGSTEAQLRQQGTVLNNLGAIYEAQGRYNEALKFYQSALEFRQRAKDTAGEGTTLNNLGGVYFRLGDNQNALKFYQNALALHQRLGDRNGEAIILNNLGFFSRSAGRYVQTRTPNQDSRTWYLNALQYYQQALTIRQAQKDSVTQAAIYNNIGAVYQDLNDYDNAIKVYKWARDIYQTLADRKGEATALNNLGGVYLSQSKLEDAKVAYEEARDAIKGEGSADEATTLSNLAFLYRSYGNGWKSQDTGNTTQPKQNTEAQKNARGYYSNALKTYTVALSIIKKLGDRKSEGAILNNIGGLHLELEQYQDALKAYKSALLVYQQLGDRPNQAAAQHNIGVTQSLEENYSEAVQSYNEALKITSQTGDRVTEAAILRNMGFAYAKERLYNRALDSYKKARSIRQELKDKAGIAAIDQEIKLLETQRKSIQ